MATNNELEIEQVKISEQFKAFKASQEKHNEEMKSLVSDFKEDITTCICDCKIESENKIKSLSDRITSNRDFIKGACAFGGGVSFVIGVIWAIGKLAISKIM